MAEAEANPTVTEPKLVNVPITKGKSTLAVDVNSIPQDVWDEVVLQGLKVLLNRGTSKITTTTYDKAEELQAAAMSKAGEQLELVMTSKIKFTGGKKKSGVAGKVMTRARQMAKQLVKQELRNAGIKISHVEASEITKAANMYLESANGAALIEKAKLALEEEEATKLAGIDVTKIVTISPKLVAAAEAKRASKSGTLSAKQAGKVKQRAKGEASAALH
jgi:hypothetical protein